MRLLFINPNTKTGLRTHCMPPIGLIGLATILKSKGHKVKLIDAYANRLSDEQILNKVSNLKPEFIGMSLSSLDLDEVYHLSFYATTWLCKC